jgi:2-polyprenyl-3-methyl-5-hydroxy-6-metoxy-1,4-benzoquinol methylase
MKLQQRSYTKEFLDRDDIPFLDIKKNMQELNFINTWLGGHQITIKGLQQLNKTNTKITVCEIGCGGGDNLAAISNWCKKNNIEIHCIGIDIKQECIDFARQNKALSANTEWIASDYATVNFAEQPDIIFSSLFCHHFSEESLTSQFQWMYNNSKTGFFINDLQRNSIAYIAIKWLTRLFSSSYLVKNDAPLSVARGFHKNELIAIFQSAEIPTYQIYWKWAFRYLAICKKPM